MTFRKIAAAALSLLCTALFLAGCAVSKDAVVATVDGENIYKWQFDLLYDQNRGYVEAQNGWNFDSPKYHAERDTFAQQLMTDIAGEKACLIEAAELGLDQLSAQELAATDAEYQKLYEDTLAVYMTEFAAEANPEVKAKEKYEITLREKYLSEEKLKMNANNNKILKKLEAQLGGSEAVTDEEVRAQYDDMLTGQKAQYAEQPALYGQQASGAIICYIPEGYVRIKHVLIGYDDEELARLQGEEQRVSELFALWAQLAMQDGNESSSATKAAQELETAQQALNNKLEAHHTRLLPTAEEVYAKAKAGEDFDALVEQYNTDPGMTVLPGRRDGYLMHETSDYVQEFKNAAFALENVGDISEPVKSFYGYHVVKLLEKVESRTVPYEEVEGDIRYQLERNRQTNRGMELRIQLLAKREVQYFPENYF